jgi:hypothetical protein
MVRMRCEGYGNWDINPFCSFNFKERSYLGKLKAKWKRVLNIIADEYGFKV